MCRTRIRGIAPRVLLACCWLLAVAPSGVSAETFTVFAAASLSNALDELVKMHQARTGDTARVSYAGSSALARQIETGAPADVFISADLAWMDYLQGKGFINAASRVDLLRNRLALIAPANSRIQLKIAPRFPLRAALGKERLAMADPASVPAGRYAKAALEHFGVWTDIQNRIAAAGDVRAALLLVARGEAPLGVVYTTDATVDPRVRTIDVFPEESHPAIVYPAALLSASGAAAAARFMQALREPAARAAFKKHGFR